MFRENRELAFKRAIDARRLCARSVVYPATGQIEDKGRRLFSIISGLISDKFSNAVTEKDLPDGCKEYRLELVVLTPQELVVLLMNERAAATEEAIALLLSIGSGGTS